MIFNIITLHEWHMYMCMYIYIYICPVLIKSVSTHKIISFLKLLFINPKNPTYFGTKTASSVRVLERNMFSMLLDSHTSQAAVKTSEILSYILLPRVLCQYVCILKREFYKCFVCKIYVYIQGIIVKQFKRNKRILKKLCAER